MVDPLPVDPLQPSFPKIDGLPGADSPAKKDEAKASAVEFRAMLERLETRASNLAEESRNVENPDELGRAVDSARASLEEALSLKDQLLEAFRQAQSQGGADRDKEAS